MRVYVCVCVHENVYMCVRMWVWVFPNIHSQDVPVHVDPVNFWWSPRKYCLSWLGVLSEDVLFFDIDFGIHEVPPFSCVRARVCILCLYAFVCFLCVYVLCMFA